MTHWRFRADTHWSPVGETTPRLRTVALWLALAVAAWSVVLACGYVFYRAAMRVFFGSV